MGILAAAPKNWLPEQIVETRSDLLWRSSQDSNVTRFETWKPADAKQRPSISASQCVLVPP